MPAVTMCKVMVERGVWGDEFTKRNLTVQSNNVNNKITFKSSVTNNLVGTVKTTLINNFNTLRVNLRVHRNGYLDTVAL